VNRGDFSQPIDILVPDAGVESYEGYKIAEIPVAAVPATFESGTYRAVVVHDPVESNYSHCEIRTLEPGSDAVAEGTKGSRKKLRTLLALRAKEVPESEWEQ
jgi:hypothetical protein